VSGSVASVTKCRGVQSALKELTMESPPRTALGDHLYTYEPLAWLSWIRWLRTLNLLIRLSHKAPVDQALLASDHPEPPPWHVCFPQACTFAWDCNMH